MDGWRTLIGTVNPDVLVKVRIMGINDNDKKAAWEAKGLFGLHLLHSPSLSEVGAGTECCYQFAFRGSFNLLSYTTQNHSSSGPGGPGALTTISNHEHAPTRLAYRSNIMLSYPEELPQFDNCLKTL